MKRMPFYILIIMNLAGCSTALFVNEIRPCPDSKNGRCPDIVDVIKEDVKDIKYVSEFVSKNWEKSKDPSFEADALICKPEVENKVCTVSEGCFCEEKIEEN